MGWVNISTFLVTGLRNRDISVDKFGVDGICFENNYYDECHDVTHTEHPIYRLNSNECMHVVLRSKSPVWAIIFVLLRINHEPTFEVAVSKNVCYCMGMLLA